MNNSPFYIFEYLSTNDLALKVGGKFIKHTMTSNKNPH
jgi:hypothetical protein